MSFALFPKKGVSRIVSIFGFVLFLFWFFFFVFNVGEKLLGLLVVLPENVRLLTKVIHVYGLFLGVINYFLGFLLSDLKISRKIKTFIGFLFIGSGIFTTFFRLSQIFPEPYSLLSSVAFFGDVFFTIGLFVFVFFHSKKNHY